MTDTTDLIARLRDNAQGISLGAEGMGWGFDEAMLQEAADALEQQAAQIAEKDAEIAALKAHALAAMHDPDACLQMVADFERQARQIAALRADAERLRASAEKVILFNRDHANDQYGDPNKAEAWACVRELRAALRQEQPAKPEPEVFSAGNPYCRECGCERLAYQYECASGRIYKCTRCGTEMQWVKLVREGEK